MLCFHGDFKPGVHGWKGGARFSLESQGGLVAQERYVPTPAEEGAFQSGWGLRESDRALRLPRMVLGSHFPSHFYSCQRNSKVYEVWEGLDLLPPKDPLDILIFSFPLMGMERARPGYLSILQYYTSRKTETSISAYASVPVILCWKFKAKFQRKAGLTAPLLFGILVLVQTPQSCPGLRGTVECGSGLGNQNIMSAVFSFIYSLLSKPTF